MRFWDRIVDAVSQLPLSSAVMRDKRERECHASVPYDHHATVIVSVGSEGCFEELIASVLGYICFKLNSWHALLGEILWSSSTRTWSNTFRSYNERYFLNRALTKVCHRQSPLCAVRSNFTTSITPLVRPRSFKLHDFWHHRQRCVHLVHIIVTAPEVEHDSWAQNTVNDKLKPKRSDQQTKRNSPSNQ